jgi:hypothetical protein
MKKFFLFAAVAMLALVGCEKPKQSALDFDKVEKVATVKGTLVAYVNAPGAATETAPLAGIRVYVQVASAKYQDKAEGNQQFAAKTGEDGSFTIEVKTGAKEIADAKLKSEDFSYTFGERVIYYQGLDEALDALNEGDIKMEYVVAKEDAVLNQTVGTATLQGKLTYDAGAQKKADGTYEEKTHAYAANVNVIAAVKYFKGDPSEVVKKFTAKTNANGEFSFAIPVETKGNDVELTIDQFKANKTVFENNAWVERPYYYTMAAAVPVAGLQANTVKIQDIVANNAEAITEDKKVISFNVIGNIYQMSEEAQKDPETKDLTGYAMGKDLTNYTFTIRLDYKDGDYESSIIYEGNKPGKEDGSFKVPVKLYDGWDVNKVTVKIYADRTIVLTGDNGFTHRYWKAASDHTFDIDVKKYKTQSVPGIFKGGKDNVLKSIGASDKQLYFDLQVGDIIIPFEAEDPAKVLGRTGMGLTKTEYDALSAEEKAKYTKTLYVGGDGDSDKRYFKESDIYEADIVEKGGKKFLDATGGIPGLW